jgi:hypothetical protein
LALAALPLLAIDNVSSADPEPAGVVAPDDPSVVLLASRAAAWGRTRSSARSSSTRPSPSANRCKRRSRPRKPLASRERKRAPPEAGRREVEQARRREASRGARPKKATTARKSTLPPPVPTGAIAAMAIRPEQWAALRECESSGDYGAVRPADASGAPVRPGHLGPRSSAALHLVGADPAAASPADQDAVALALFRIRGTSPWPRCGAAFR